MFVSPQNVLMQHPFHKRLHMILLSLQSFNHPPFPSISWGGGNWLNELKLWRQVPKTSLKEAGERNRKRLATRIGTDYGIRRTCIFVHIFFKDKDCRRIVTGFRHLCISIHLYLHIYIYTVCLKCLYRYIYMT